MRDKLSVQDWALMSAICKKRGVFFRDLSDLQKAKMQLRAVQMTNALSDLEEQYARDRLDIQREAMKDFDEVFDDEG